MELTQKRLSVDASNPWSWVLFRCIAMLLALPGGDGLSRVAWRLPATSGKSKARRGLGVTSERSLS